jgi:hypothetical protein
MSTTQQRLNEIAEQEKKLADEKAKLLEASKDADLEMVKKLCKQHGFTATQLRGSLKIKGKAKAKGEKAVAKKTAAKKTPAKK